MKTKNTSEPQPTKNEAKHTPPPYSEHGPVWTVYPVERSEELGTTTNYIVADLDFDARNLTGNFLAECESFKDAAAIADALNRERKYCIALEQIETRTLEAGGKGKSAMAMALYDIRGIIRNCWTIPARAAIAKAKGQQ